MTARNDRVMMAAYAIITHQKVGGVSISMPVTFDASTTNRVRQIALADASTG